MENGFRGVLGFRAGRTVRGDCAGQDESTEALAGCWTRRLRQLGVADARVVGAAATIVLGHHHVPAPLLDDGELYRGVVGWLPEARLLYTRYMPMGPCPVGGAPGARTQLEVLPLPAR